MDLGSVTVSLQFHPLVVAMEDGPQQVEWSTTGVLD